MATYGSQYVMCPFYHRHDRLTVTCEGPEDGMLVQVIHNNRGEINRTMRRFCCTEHFMDCPLAKIALDKYNHP